MSTKKIFPLILMKMLWLKRENFKEKYRINISGIQIKVKNLQIFSLLN
jgi:hypothetical protein